MKKVTILLPIRTTFFDYIVNSSEQYIVKNITT